MADTETATVGLNLGGDFASQAEQAAASGKKLSDSLEGVAGAAKKLNQPIGADAHAMAMAHPKVQAVTKELERQAQLEAQIATFDAARVRNIAALEARYKAMKDHALGIGSKGPSGPGGDIQMRGLEGMGSQSILGGAVALGGAAGVAFKAGEKILEASLALAKGAAELLIAGEKLAIEQTAKKEVQGTVLKSMGGDYEQTVKMALKLGLDPDATIGETKKLLNAHFKATEIPALIRIKAGMDLKLGEGKGDALLEKLEKIQLEPKVKSKDIDGLWKVGIDSKEVYQKLAQTLHTDVAGAMAKVKKGAVDSKDVIAAIEGVAGQSFGKFADIAADTVPALVNRLKGDFLELFAFDPAILQPIKDALHTVLGVLEGPEGEALKASLQEVFAEVGNLFKGISKQDVQVFFKVVAKDAHEFADALREAAPALKIIAKGLEFGTLGALSIASDVLRGFGIITRNVIEDVEALEAIVDSFSVDNIVSSIQGLAQEAWDAGTSLVDGLVQGIEDGASRAIDAAAEMASKALKAAKEVLGIASPSSEFAEVGHFSAEGMAKGIVGNDNASAAAASMAGGALGAAGAVAGAGAGAGGGGGNLTLIFNIAGGGSPDAVADAVMARMRTMPEFRSWARRLAREKREAG